MYDVRDALFPRQFIANTYKLESSHALVSTVSRAICL